MSRERRQAMTRRHDNPRPPLSAANALLTFAGRPDEELALFAEAVATEADNAGWGDVGVALREVARRLRLKGQQVDELTARLEQLE